MTLQNGPNGKMVSSINVRLGAHTGSSTHNEFEEFRQNAFILHGVVSDTGTGRNVPNYTKCLFFDFRRMRQIEHIIQLLDKCERLAGISSSEITVSQVLPYASIGPNVLT